MAAAVVLQLVSARLKGDDDLNLGCGQVENVREGGLNDVVESISGALEELLTSSLLGLAQSKVGITWGARNK